MNFVFIFYFRPVVRQILNISRLVVNHIWQSLIVLAQSRMATLILRRHQSYTRQIKPYANLRFSKRFQPLGKKYWHILYVICAQEFMKWLYCPTLPSLRQSRFSKCHLFFWKRAALALICIIVGSCATIVH